MNEHPKEQEEVRRDDVLDATTTYFWEAVNERDAALMLGYAIEAYARAAEARYCGTVGDQELADIEEKEDIAEQWRGAASAMTVFAAASIIAEAIAKSTDRIVEAIKEAQS